MGPSQGPEAMEEKGTPDSEASDIGPGDESAPEDGDMDEGDSDTDED